MPFEFAFLDWLYQFRNPVMNAISIFFDYAGAHGEIWIAFTLLLLLFRRTRKAGFAMAVALVLYMAAGHFILKPLFARPRPCDINTTITTAFGNFGFITIFFKYISNFLFKLPTI